MSKLTEVDHARGAYVTNERQPDRFYCKNCRRVFQHTKQQKSRVFMSGKKPWVGDVTWHECPNCQRGVFLVGLFDEEIEKEEKA